MQAVELVAAIHAIEHAREMFDAPVTVPYMVADLAKMIIISNEVHSIITSKPIKINGENIVISEKRITTSKGMKTSYYECGAEHRVQNFVLHAFDGASHPNISTLLLVTMGLAIDMLGNGQAATNAVIAAAKRSEKDAATIKELTERIKLLSQTKE